MKLFYDFFPVLVFFIVYKLSNIYTATGALIIASAIQIGYLWLRKKRVEPMYLITFLLVLVFGGITIMLHDAMYLKWKVSIVNWLFGFAFLVSQFFGRKTLVQFLFESSTDHHGKHPAIDLPKTVWGKLNLIWTLYFLMIGFINIYVAYRFSTAIWVDFKVFGMIGLTLLFVLAQTAYLYKHIQSNKNQITVK